MVRTAKSAPYLGNVGLVQKYIGDNFLEEVKAEIQEGNAVKSETYSPLNANALNEAFDSTSESISTLIDKSSQASLESYQLRSNSRATFKKHLRTLIENLADQELGKQPPFFVIIDELDRCRPDYAINFLEQVKHLFDINNIVFIIAINANQLSKSISAVYGEKFDCEDYLRRFFTRKYELRSLSVEEIIKEEYHLLNLKDENFYVPEIVVPDRPAQVSAAEFIGLVLDDLNVSPREAGRVMDALALFHDQWIAKFEIELVVLLPMIVHLVRAEPISMQPNSTKGMLYLQGIGPDQNGRIKPLQFAEVATMYSGLVNNPLPQLAEQRSYGPGAYLTERFQRELQVVHGNRWQKSNPPKSLLNSYADILKLVERFTDDVADEFEAQFNGVGVK